MEKEYKVVFLPEDKKVFSISGTSVFEAANRAGISITVPCGGAGKCGKCRVRLVKGSLNQPTPQEKTLLSPADIKKGVRLSCKALITGNCEIEVPQASRIGAANILVSGRLKKVKINPGIKKTFHRTESPRMGDHVSYAGILEKKAGCASAGISVLRSIPSVVLDNPEGATLLCRDGKLIAVEKGDTSAYCLGAAFDLGTTTLAGTLLNVLTGKELAVTSRLNPQISFGDDLISRINFARQSSHNLQTISGAIITAVNEMIEELSKKAGTSRRHIYKLVVAGNTAMQHIFCRINPGTLGELPFIPVVREPVRMNARESGIDISPGGEVYVFPTIGGFVGGDAVAATLASGMASSKKIRILIDIGTNGEIMVGSKNKLLCASAAAGPAFESARISMGMVAGPGAIEKVIIDKTVHINVIGNFPPRGICGSGIIDAAAQMLEAGVIDSYGRIVSKAELPARVPADIRKRIVEKDGQAVFVLSGAGNHEQIYVTQRDIRELQLAKSAVYSGIRILKQKLGIKLQDVEEVLIAGAFGNFIRRSSARRIGLIPDIDSSKIKFIGNASSSGAKLLLLSKEKERQAEKIADAVRHVELAVSASFQQEFAENMLFKDKK